MPGAVRLLDGRVLVAGGYVGNNMDSGSVARAELYDPAAGTWAPAAPMREARGMFSLSVLHDGRVLAAGGYAYGDLASAEIYHPARDMWSSAGGMFARRRLHTAVTLENGDVLVVGGYAGSQLRTTELYSPCRG